jgi:cytosine/adenosine deaminase-related metal-dependent hydrolase
MSGSLAPHAPYSTSLDLIQKISTYNSENSLPSSIHNQESQEESKFFSGEKNGFQDLYAFLQMDLSWFAPPRTTSLQYYLPAIGEQQTLLIHNSFTNSQDIASTNGKNIYWCFCPGANIYIEDRLPDFRLFAGETGRICVGTDSLASNGTLSVIDEANFLMRDSAFGIEDILSAITCTPAKALNLEKRFGKLLKGKSSGLNLLEIKNRELKFIRRIF